MKKAWFPAIAGVGLAAAASWAQSVPQPVPLSVPQPGLPPPFVLMRGEDAFEKETVRGLPFTARTETELVQTLADGNRISAHWTGFVARDGEGRVRREQPLAAIGPLLAGPSAPRLTVIVDPVRRSNWFLDSDAKAVRRMAWPPEGGRSRPGLPGPPGDAAAASVTESLGSREIVGVEAQGKRSTYVIPAGQFGNERPLSIVNESWSSAELHVVLETRHSDPRFGETRFRLTEFQQGEPDRALFEVPAGYVVEDGPPRPGPFGPPRPGSPNGRP